MAAFAAASRSIFRSPAARSAASTFASQSKTARSPYFRIPSQRPSSIPLISRSPVEMSACVDSLLPLHSATASSLMTSMLSVSPQSYGWLSEGQDETR